MELKITDLTKEFQDITAVKAVSYTLTPGLMDFYFGEREGERDAEI